MLASWSIHGVSAALLCLGVGFATAKPWHKVNQFDSSGNTCQAPLRYSQRCPVLCVRDISLCPPAVQPTACPADQFYCQDGLCHPGGSIAAACPPSLASVCSCGVDIFVTGISPIQSAGAVLFPCANTQPRVNVRVWSNSTDIVGESPAGDTDLAFACSEALNLNSTLSPTHPANSTIIPVSSSTPFFLQCLITAKMLSMHEPEFMLFYGFVAAQSIVLILFQIYRSIRFSSSHGFTSGSSKQTTVFEHGNVEMDEMFARPLATAKLSNNKIKFNGYRQDPLGSLVLISVIISSFVWLFLMSILIGDYYQIFSGYSFRGTQMIFGNHDNLSRIFIVLWHIMAICPNCSDSRFRDCQDNWSSKSQQRVLDMATFRGRAKVLRDNVWSSVDCSKLVPGDVIEVEASGEELCRLIAYWSRVKQLLMSRLFTGEALPVAKFSIKNVNRPYNSKGSEKTSTLIAGCQILESHPAVDGSLSWRLF
ncbi:hypothetical protein BASA81_011734 [Batrachochytrium salamandrivorans]|nr:hypothetical protein BASA81_011734 [Batrachochytrium salamandrivorans]